MSTSKSLPVLKPDLQISFHYRLQSLRGLYLGGALGATVERVDLKAVNRELDRYVTKASLKKVATAGLRGELFFAVPLVIRANPYLVGYYRLLLGFSQKEFYNKGPFGGFKKLEEAGQVSPAADARVPGLCRSLAGSAELLVSGLDRLSPQAVHDLQLLTLGPQLRGSQNTKLGRDADRQVYDLIQSVVEPYLKASTNRSLTIENDSGRIVQIDFASDPDVRIAQELASGERPLVSIEVKGGTDQSNVHNRLGEAEKSHQKAKARGFFEFWTIIRLDVNASLARQESPTTTHLFHLDRISKPSTRDAKQFRELLSALVGISSRGRRKTSVR